MGLIQKTPRLINPINAIISKIKESIIPVQKRLGPSNASRYQSSCQISQLQIRFNEIYAIRVLKCAKRSHSKRLHKEN